MAYNQFAESYGVGKTPSQQPWPFTTPEGWCRFDDVYSNIADATPIGREFRRRDILNLPVLAKYARKTKTEVLSVVLRDMCNLSAEAGAPDSPATSAFAHTATQRNT